VWLVVSPHNPFKPAGTLVEAADRLAMARIAVERSGLTGRVSVSDIELGLPAPSYTIRTLRALWEAWPERRFSILVGSDNLPHIHLWREAECILARCPICVYERSGFPMTKDNKLNYTPMEGAPLLEISSTQIRDLLERQKPIPALLPPGVYDYITEHGLYRIDR